MPIIDGKELEVSPSSFSDSIALKEAIAKALKENGIKINLSGIKLDSKKLEEIEVGEIGWILEPIMTLVTDSNIRNHLFKCCKPAMFDKNQINESFFDDPENRKYYYPIMAEVLKVNIFPFFGLASSLFSNLPGLKDTFQKLTSKLQK